MSIYIDDIQFPSIALSHMKAIRLEYSKTLQYPIHIHTIYPPTIIASIREFLDRYGDIELKILLPRNDPITSILPRDVLDWFYVLDNDQLWLLHNAAYTLGYSRLFEITSLVLSEVLDVSTLMSM